MIGIRVNQELLELPEDFTLNVEWVNPLFTEEVGYGSETLRARLPDTPHNRRLLGAVGSPNVVAAGYEFPCAMELGGGLWREGLLTVIDANGEEIGFSIALEESALARALGDTPLRDLNWGGNRVITTTNPSDGPMTQPSDMMIHANATTTGTVDSHDYVFAPVEVRDGYGVISQPQDYFRGAGDGVIEVNQWVNDSFWDEIRLYFNANPGGYCPLIPFPYLIYILRQVMAQSGYTLDETDTWLQDQQIRSLVVWNNQTLDKGYTYTIIGQFVNRTANLHTQTINVRNHIPDLTLRDLMGRLRQGFNLAILTEGDRVRLYWKGEALTAPVVDWREKTLGLQTEPYQTDFLFRDRGAADEGIPILDPEKENPTFISTVPPAGGQNGDTYLNPNSRLYFQKKLVEESDPAVLEWVLKGILPTEVAVGNGKEETDAGFGWMAVSTAKLGIPGAPITQGRINTPLYGLEPVAPEQDLRLMFYRGMVVGAFSSGNAIPTLTTTEYDHNAQAGSLPADAYGLNWDGDRGLFQTWWKPWTDRLLQAHAVNVPLALELADVHNLRADRRYLIRTREGEAYLLPMTVKVSLGMEGVISAHMEALSI